MPSVKARASTQDHLDIEDIIDDLLLLKTGWVALVLATTAVNFDILSEAEQDATIYAYGALLNSLSFPVQILIRSKRADITSYFHKLAEAEATQANPDLKRQIQRYEDFIQSTVQQKTVLDKKFYLVLTYSPLEKGLRGIKSQPPNVRAKDKKAQVIVDAKIALAPKRDHLIRQTARLGLSSRQLTTQELIELFYDIYNPAPSGTQRVILDSASYTVPLVEPALEIPSPAPTGAGPTPAPSEPEALRRTGGSSEPEVRAGGQTAPITQPTATIPTLATPPIPKPQISQSPKVTDAREALKNLQAATEEARQFVNQQPPTQINQENRTTTQADGEQR